MKITRHDIREANRIAAKKLAINGLLTDGSHHKQWYLEEILKALGYDINDIKKKLIKKGYDWDEGIAP